VEKITPQELQLMAHAKIVVVAEVQIMKHIEVQIEDELGFTAGVREFAIGESTSNGKKMIGDAFHGRDDHGDVGGLRSGADKTRSMEHAVRTEERRTPKLEGDDVARLLVIPASAVHAKVQCGGA
jgi:hypothetical protein